VKVYENTVWGNGFGIEIGGYIGATLDSIGVFNNLIYRNKNAGVRITRYDGPSGEFAMRNVSIMNNTIYGNGTVGNGWDADNGGMNIFNIIPVNMRIQNNILSNNAVCTIYVSPEVLAGSLTIDYNLFDGFRNFVNENVGTNAVYGIPLFVDSLRNDYHLQATSPCVDKGNPSQEYNDPQDSYKPGYAVYPAQGTIRNDIGAYGGPYASSWDLATSVARPQTPVLYSPADSARGVSTSPVLSWNRILGADRYRVQLSTSVSFGSKLVDDSMVTDSYRQVGPLLKNTVYYWRVSAINAGGTSSYSAERTFTTIVASAVEQLDDTKVTEFALAQNFPNPFNPSTTICYGLPNRSHVTLTVFNTLGQQVADLLIGEQDAGYHEVKFDGSGLSSGVYLYRLDAGGVTLAKRMIVMK